MMRLDEPVRRDVITRTGEYASPKHLSVVEIKLARHHLNVEEFESPPRALVVGENPGENTHPDLPLFPWPETSSAGRLMKMSDLTPAQYLGHLYRRNLCDTRGEYRRIDAKHRARELLTALFDMPPQFRVILCGSKVATAFGVDVGFWQPVRLTSRQTAVVIPHPSGMNRVYNTSSARRMTREWMRWATLEEKLP